MSAPYGFREAPGLEEDETQQHRVSHAGPDGPHQVATRRDTLRQHGGEGLENPFEENPGVEVVEVVVVHQHLDELIGHSFGEIRISQPAAGSGSCQGGRCPRRCQVLHALVFAHV